MLFILKWLGILLLAVLGLLVFLLILLLAVPLRYQLKARADQSVKAILDVGWLLKLAHIRIALINLQALLRLKLFGFSVYKKHLGDWGEEKEEQEQAIKKSGDEAAVTVKEEKPEKADSDNGSQKPKETSKPSEPAQEKELDKKQDYDKLFSKLAQENERKSGSEKSPEEEKQKKLKESYNKITDFLQDEKNQETLRLCAEQIKKAGRHLKPTYFLLEGEVGLKDPADTARLLAWIYRLYPLFGDAVRIRGNFEEPAVDLLLVIRGRLRLGTLLWIAGHLWMNKNFRSWIKKKGSDPDEDHKSIEAAEANGAAA